MLGKFIAVSHLLIAIFLSFYAFLVSSNFLYDYLYVTLLLISQIQWILLNGECIFSYIYKLSHYDNYRCGNTTTLDDFNELDFFSNEPTAKQNENSTLTQTVNLVFCFAIILSILTAIIRSRIANPFLALFVLVILRFFYLFLNNATGYDTNKIGNSLLGHHYKPLEDIYYTYTIDKIHDEINSVIVFVLVSFWLYITYKNKGRLVK